MKKTWENPNLANLALGETKTVQSRWIEDGKCSNCGEENVENIYDHSYNRETGLYKCDLVQPQS